MSYGDWPKYVSVAERKAKALKKVAALKKKGKIIYPVEISGRTIARSFWGKAWCQHLEKFSDYENRLPRGRTYVRNGSVCHLEISEGCIKAMVAGSSMYNIHIDIDPLPKAKWKSIQQQCAGSVGSMVELLQGKLSDSVMRSVTDQNNGLFPKPAEIHLRCDCPDWAELCKHLAAVLYGVGARLDDEPQLLFLLRGVDQRDLIADDLAIDIGDSSTELGGDLAELFGIDIDDSPLPEAVPPKKKVAAKKVLTKKKAEKKKTVIRLKSKKVSWTKSVKRTRRMPPKIKMIHTYSAETLEDFRAKHTLTQQDLAQLVGKSLVTVKKWENQTGDLKLQQSSIEALKTVMAMTKKKVQQLLAEK